jgi:tetratricopeptide (TPR) repeat protein
MLESLANKSLIVGELVEEDASRFRLLELMRAYGLERLAASGEEMALRRRHAEYYLALAERAEPELIGQDQSAWLRRLGHEHDNLRAALAWSVETGMNESGAIELGLRLAGAVWRYWEKRGHLGEGRLWLGKVLAQSHGVADSHTLMAQAQALYGASVLAHRQRDEDEARALAEELLALRRRLGDRTGAAAALNALAVYAADAGENERALVLHEESLAIKREMGDVWGIPASLGNLGTVLRNLGRYREAAGLCEQALALNRQLEDASNVALNLCNLGEMQITLGNYPRAAVLLEEGTALAREHEVAWLLAFGLNNLSVALRYLGQPEQAHEVALEGLALSERVGDRIERGNNLVELGELARDAGDLDQAESYYREALAIYREARNDRFVALGLNCFGLVAHLRGDFARAHALHRESLALYRTCGYKFGAVEALEATASDLCDLGQSGRAAMLYGATDAWRAAAEAPIPPPERPIYDRHLVALRSVLGEEAFTAARQRGAAMPLEEAVDAAVSTGLARQTGI